MKNNLSDLNNHLFSMLELLENDEEMADSKKLDEAIKRSKAVCSVCTQILNVARVQVSAIKTAEACGLLNKDMPALIATKDSGTETENRQKLLGVAK